MDTFANKRQARYGVTLWFTGLPCSGKTTLVTALAGSLARRGQPYEVLDGDLIRQRLSKGLGFSKQDRIENNLRVAFLASRLTGQGVTTLVSLVSPYREAREAARREIGRFIEIYVQCPLSVCKKRDVKGMYRLARRGKLRGFTGVSDPYEVPEHPELVIDTDRLSVQRSVKVILNYLDGQGLLRPEDPFADDELLSKAFYFAARHHESQERKGGAPYITHPVSVAKILKKAGYPSAVCAAGLLHDVLEDTWCDLEDLKRAFGPEVTRWVCEVTDKNKTAPWRERKADYLKGLKTASREGLAIACADKADNLASLVSGYKVKGPQFGALFSGSMDEKLSNYKNIYEVIRSRYKTCPILVNYRTQLVRLQKISK